MLACRRTAIPVTLGIALVMCSKWLLFSALKLFICDNRQKHQLSMPFHQQNFVVIFNVTAKSITAGGTVKNKVACYAIVQQKITTKSRHRQNCQAIALKYRCGKKSKLLTCQTEQC
ncbi:hypothetical protein [Rheinheimera sediminis]|uniref:hypothetical protein n=1 Tax=Rheinheimera sp. YQF-1 TaxID=2499626 RepID=UPI000FD74DB6|nr:hypothetical protein [Rheinheimera sp. YQF-1]